MATAKAKIAEVAAPDICPICDCEQFDLVCPWKDKQIVKCSACGLVRTHPRPSEEELVQLYAEGELLREPNEDEVFEKIEFPEWKAKEHRRILSGLARFGIRSGRLLDVGCLWGAFLDSARRNGFEAVGVEPYERAARYARNVLRLEVHSGSLRSAPLAPASFDAITILDVIEHLRDPVDELKAMRALLKPNGVLAVVTPNVNGLPTLALGLKRRMLGQAWCPIDDLPWHLWGFTPRTMAKALDGAGFRVLGMHGLPPSIFTTNSGAGANGWKRFGLEMLGRASIVTGHSDRLIAYARRTDLAALTE